MKSLIAVLFVMPAIAFGGACYKTTQYVPSPIPKMFCIDTIKEGVTAGQIDVVSSDISMPKILRVSSLIRHNEDRVKFVATADLIHVNYTCGEGLDAKLEVKGEFNVGDIDPKYLEVSVISEQTNDTCHMEPQEQKVIYSYVKPF